MSIFRRSSLLKFCSTSFNRYQCAAFTSSTSDPLPKKHIEKSLCGKLCILGGGQMCEALLGALHIKDIQHAQDIYVVDPHEKRLEFLQKKYHVNVTTNPNTGIKDAEIVILAVKPQNVSSLAASLTAAPSGLLLSIVAGCTVAELRKSFQTSKVVRSMPNTPAMVLEGITVWLSTPETPAELVEKTKTLLNSLGDQIQVYDEHYVDMATAVSGSGPAYVFLTMEAMIDAAVHLGFPRDMATKLVISTIKGSATYALQSSEHAVRLRNNVTSPGGTTASALYALDRGGFRTVVADAIWAAYRRALELGGKDPNVGPR
jgi:pyrroline-5-carboxylate reductase